jgi:putative phosphoesterase
MVYAVISDIHANFVALKEAFKIIGDDSVEKVIVAGDLVGKGPQPFEVLDFLFSRNVIAVKGNSDEKFIKSRSAKNSLTKGEKKLLDWLKGLPKIAFQNSGVLVCHGSPQGTTDYIYPSITEYALKHKIQNFTTPKVLCCGHSHIPFVKQVGDVFIANAGSVGRPIDGDPRGSLILLDIREEKISGEMVRFGYNLQKLEAVMLKEGYTRKQIRAFVEGRKTV